MSKKAKTITSPMLQIDTFEDRAALAAILARNHIAVWEEVEDRESWESSAIHYICFMAAPRRDGGSENE